MKKSFLTLMATVAVFSVIAVGCGGNEEPVTSGAAPSTQDQENSENAATPEEDAKAIEKAKLSAIGASRIAEEKITSIFETKTVGEVDVNVAKSNYPTIEDVKTLWSVSMSDNFVTESAKLLKEEELPELGKVVTLTIPEDYVSINDISFTDVDLNNVTVEGDNATVKATVGEKTVIYSLVKKEDKWVVDTKTVE